MESLSNFVGLFWGSFTVVAQIISLGLIVSLFVPAVRNSAFARFFADRAILVGFVASLLATAGSLVYSDVLGFAPCKFCWFQRIFMYPQVLLMGIALWRKDVGMKLYGFLLSTIGAAIALYHYSGQFGIAPLPCSAVGQSVSCSERFVTQFGYITIPLMAFSAFLMMALSFWISMRKDRAAKAAASAQN
ncbi:MAG TPA: disulfide oxidoreductase [Candidatus Paceibacterota bacterium]